ncbi:MAG: DinB family protein [Pyrinomonadaceae bacterium]
MSVKDTLIDQFTACYDENHWFVATRNAVDGVTAEQALWKPSGFDNSIWQIVSHLSFYLYAYLERFRGVDYEYPTDNNDETFSADNQDAEQGWEKALTSFDTIMTEFREEMSAATDSKFESPVSESNRVKWRTQIAHINAHTAYHCGQILLLRKLQGSWDKQQGVS